jgi:hypothetical protein
VCLHQGCDAQRQQGQLEERPAKQQESPMGAAGVPLAEAHATLTVAKEEKTAEGCPVSRAASRLEEGQVEGLASWGSTPAPRRRRVVCTSALTASTATSPVMTSALTQGQ